MRMTTVRKFVSCVMFVAVAAWAGRSASAQDAQRTAPKLPPANSPATLQPAAPTSQPAGDEKVLDDLKGLIFVADQQQVVKTPQGAGIDTSKTPLLDNEKFRTEIASYLGKPLTMVGLNDICRATVLYCRSVDRPIVNVVVPEQDVTGGTVQILVIEGRLGEVTAEGNRYFQSDRLTGAVRAQQGDVLSQKQLLEDVDWLNRNPFRHSDLVFEPGANFGQTDVVLATNDHVPFRLFAGYEDTGTQSTGEDRYFVGFNWGDAFFLDHQLNYQYTFNGDVNRFQAHGGSYIAPLPWRHVLTLFGSWSTSEVETSPDVFMKGEGWQASGRYEIPLPAFQGVKESLVLGGDFKRTNNNAEFGGTNVYASDVDVVQFMIGYQFDQVDPYGGTSGVAEVFWSPGGIGGQDNDAAYDLARAGAEANYIYFRGNIERETRLWKDFSWVSRLEGQVSGDLLLSSEQLGVGGFDTVRGYEEREANGDYGLVFRNELRTPAVGILNAMGVRKVTDELQLLAFIDYGVAFVRDTPAGEQSRFNLLGVGPGLRYQIGPYLNLEYAYGFRLAAGDREIDETGHHHFRVVASFTY